MAKLTTGERNALPASQFALPGGRFPIPDSSHAIDAKARATQGVNAGTLSPAERVIVDRKANAKLGQQHPRVHALSMASADHLHRQGYIGQQQHQSIRGQAQARMDAHKAQAPVFGALAPAQ